MYPPVQKLGVRDGFTSLRQQVPDTKYVKHDATLIIRCPTSPGYLPCLECPLRFIRSSSPHLQSSPEKHEYHVHHHPLVLKRAYAGEHRNFLLPGRYFTLPHITCDTAVHCCLPLTERLFFAQRHCHCCRPFSCRNSAQDQPNVGQPSSLSSPSSWASMLRSVEFFAVWNIYPPVGGHGAEECTVGRGARGVRLWHDTVK